MEKRQKRYQHYTKDGIQWTDWFDHHGTEVQYQLDKKLKNEYRTVKV